MKPFSLAVPDWEDRIRRGLSASALSEPPVGRA